MSFFLELAKRTETNWDFAMENLDRGEAELALPWLFRPQADAFKGLFADSDDKLLEETKLLKKAKFPIKSIKGTGYLKEFYLDKPITDTKQIVEAIKHWEKVVNAFAKAFPEILKSIRGQVGKGKWEDHHPNHYESVINAMGDGVGTRKLERKSFLGVYTVVVLNTRTSRSGKGEAITNGAGDTSLLSALTTLETTLLTLRRLKNDVGMAIELTVKESGGFGSIIPGKAKALNKYYAAAVNPYISMTNYHTTLYSSYIKLLKSLME